MSLIRQITTRVIAAAVTLVVIAFAVFWITEVLPGDATGVLSGQDATPEERAAIAHALGLDRPPLERMVDWAWAALQGDFGASLVSDRPVAAIIAARVSASAAIVLPAAVAMLVVGTTIGSIAGMHAGGRLDRVLGTITIALAGIPDFLIATALMVLCTAWIPLVPAVALIPAGDTIWQHPELVVLPALTLALGGTAPLMRVMRAAAADVASTPYAQFARLNGMRGIRYARLVVPNAMAPAVQAFSVMLAGLVGGAIIVESLFNVPGLGAELASAIRYRDVPLVQGLSLVLAATALAILLCGDIVAGLARRRVYRAGDE